MPHSDKLLAIKYSREDGLWILDQLKIPAAHDYLEVKNATDGCDVIRRMNVRGAPAIGIVAALSLAVDLWRDIAAFDGAGEKCLADVASRIEKAVDHLATARPTAVNLFRSCQDIKGIVKDHLSRPQKNVRDLATAVIEFGEKLFLDDVVANMTMGLKGAEDVLRRTCNDSSDKVTILTHCNTGSLATGGYGTALGVVRALHEKGRLEMVYFTETRPYNQGSRLTACELAYDGIPSCLICDSMAGALMQRKKVSAVVVGADRIAANGDTANKIGTYSLAILAHAHGIPFYVAAPTTTLNMSTRNGDGIEVEERPEGEVVTCGCSQKIRVPPQGIRVWNPAFDVTPAKLITGGIITEVGILSTPANPEESLKIPGEPQ